MAAKAESTTVMIDGRTLKLTNLDKVLYPETGTTKADVLAYYAEIAPVLIRHAHDRPVTRKRWVNGVGTVEHPEEVFFQKNLEDSAPAWVPRNTIRHKSHTNVYPMLNDEATLAWLAQIAALEIHTPQWRFDADGRPQHPDRLVLDLDPGEGVGLRECVEVAKHARDILTGMGLDPVPVTSGSKGIHLYAPLDGRQSSDEVSAVAHELARVLEADHPDLVLSTIKKVDRRGKVFVDWSQNNAAKTTVSPYSLRGRPRPFVAAPRTWRELSSPSLRQLEYHEVLKRVRERGDPLAHADSGAVGDVETATSAPLSVYRSKRRAGKTPEPIPEAGAAPATDADGRSFVIQKHAARRLHYDFRLERDGVLISWAVPKGVPKTTKQNHLAVHVEDHPLEYGSFSGDIPKGEYGAGHVDIWDHGTYQVEKWRDGKEVIVTLHGQQNGGLGVSTKVALIHTGGAGRAENNWLIHRMQLDSGATGESSPNQTASAHESSTNASSAHASSAPRSYAPMLAKPGEEMDVGGRGEWALEMKWDGIRALAHVEGGRVRLVSRNGNDLTAGYPELAELARKLEVPSAVLDGEIVAVDPDGRPDFGLLQTRMKLTRPADVKRVQASAPVRFMLFDILERDGEDVTRREYDERRALLEQTVSNRSRGAVRVPPVFRGSMSAAMKRSRELRLEGVMAKRRDSTYASGRRSSEWIKVKHHATQEVVVAGWRTGNGRRADTIGSLLLCVNEHGALRYVGRVGTGFDDRELDELRRVLDRQKRKTSPLGDVPSADARDAHWVRPSLVGEVEFAEWTSGGRLRQPRWRGWRPDKNPDDVVVER
jgi:DNA ligase D, 3''-phosphoesterase domain/DNA polymerase LigD, polymerase domain/DNA polymerase LigD, ligase domain